MIDFEKSGGLVPVIVQDDCTLKVLMLGYMSPEAYEKTVAEGRVTFYSRSRQCLWTKGETSGNFLDVVSIAPDCDNDALLIRATPHGPTCHTGKVSCFDAELPHAQACRAEGAGGTAAIAKAEGKATAKAEGKGFEEMTAEKPKPSAESALNYPEGFIRRLGQVIKQRHQDMPEGSYTTYLFNKGINKMAQKVGEEAIETVIEAVADNQERLIYEASDLVYHLLVLLEARGLGIADIERELLARHK